ncbi:hypothetical protein [Desulfobacca acetoxidans]
MRRVIFWFFILCFLSVGGTLDADAGQSENSRTTPPQTADWHQAVEELKANIKELRSNTASLVKIKQDSHLSATDRKTWLDKAKAYSKECVAYLAALDKLNTRQLQKDDQGRLLLQEKQAFQRELQYFREVLEKP